VQIKYSPIRKTYETQEITYEFGDDLVIATMDGQQDTFDFSALPDGKATEITSILPINPIERAWRKNGELYVVLRRFYGENSTQEERFPDWQEVG